MTDLEQAIVRDLRARIRELERENRYLRQHRDKARTERDRFKNTSRFLHGICIANRIEVTP